MAVAAVDDVDDPGAALSERGDIAARRTPHAPTARAASAIIVRNAPSDTSSAKSRRVSIAARCILVSPVLSITVRS